CMHISAFSFHCALSSRDLHSFPTRRSSDLAAPHMWRVRNTTHGVRSAPLASVLHCSDGVTPQPDMCGPLRVAFVGAGRMARLHRSEEHTSELQSRFDLVCRLLLEKKKHAALFPQTTTSPSTTFKPTTTKHSSYLSPPSIYKSSFQSH